MKLLIKVLSFFIIFGLFGLKAFAIDAPMNLKTDYNGGTTVNLTWDTSSGAFMYYVSYGKTSGGPYENQTDSIEDTNLTINSLELGTTYYFVVTALDENGEESISSNEIAIDIVSPVFALNNINVIANNKIELVFSDLLDSKEGTQREFNIYKQGDKLDSIEITSTELNIDDNHKLDLILDRDLEIGVKYEVVVLAIQNIKGKNIESGIDSIETFTLDKSIINSTGSLVNTGSIMTKTGNVDDLNSASETGSVNSNKNIGPTGVNIDEGKLESTTLGAASNNKKLPKTGPEEILIFIFSIILAGIFFIFKYKKA